MNNFATPTISQSSDLAWEKVLPKAALQFLLRKLAYGFAFSQGVFCRIDGFLQSSREVWRWIPKNKAANARIVKRVSPLETA